MNLYPLSLVDEGHLGSCFSCLSFSSAFLLDSLSRPSISVNFNLTFSPSVVSWALLPNDRSGNDQWLYLRICYSYRFQGMWLGGRWLLRGQLKNQQLHFSDATVHAMGICTQHHAISPCENVAMFHRSCNLNNNVYIWSLETLFQQRQTDLVPGTASGYNLHELGEGFRKGIVSWFPGMGFRTGGVFICVKTNPTLFSRTDWKRPNRPTFKLLGDYRISRKHTLPETNMSP